MPAGTKYKGVKVIGVPKTIDNDVSFADITFGLIIQNGINCSPLIGVICMASSMILTFAISLFTKQLDNKIIEKAFNDVLENN